MPPVPVERNQDAGTVDENKPEDGQPGEEPYYPGCAPLSCAERNTECGLMGDGCGAVVDCGTCDAPDTCGGGGTPSQCGHSEDSCVPRTCVEVEAECGAVADGCGGIVECGECAEAGESCGGGGTPFRCGAPLFTVDNCPALLTCDDVGAECGLLGNGCGGVLDCGVCSTTEGICGGGGVPNRCAPLGCLQRTCEEVDPAFCGVVPDGCGDVLEGCGAVCAAGETCGGGGVADRCGTGSVCTPKTYAELCAAGDCGPVSNGCGGGGGLWGVPVSRVLWRRRRPWAMRCPVLRASRLRRLRGRLRGHLRRLRWSPLMRRLPDRRGLRLWRHPLRL